MDNREIERKYKLTSGQSEERIEIMIRDGLFKKAVKRVYKGQGTDYFWEFGPKKFLRLRVYHERIGGQLTLKENDLGGIENRLEINSNVTETDKLKELLTNMLGPHSFEIYKRYTNIFLHDGTILCTYKTDFLDDTIFEIELATNDKPGRFILVENILKQEGIELERINKSLLELKKETVNA